MKDNAAVLGETNATLVQPRIYFGRVQRKQGLFGSVSVVGTIVGTTIDYIPDAKRRFPKDGTVETQGVAQHAGLSQGDWVEFDAVKNTRPRASEYKVAHIRRIPRYAELLECTGEASLRAVLNRTGWRGDRRAGLWALKVYDDRVVIVDLELHDDGALRIPRSAARSVAFFDFSDDAVVRLDAAEPSYLVPKREPDGHFDWSDETDHVARVIRSLATVDDSRIGDLIAWLELHHESGTGRISAAGVDHDAALDALRSGELAERLRADRELMRAYLEAATRDPSVAAVVAEYAREGHTEARAKLLRELEGEIAERRSQLVAAQEDDLAQARKTAEADVEEDIRTLRNEKLGELESAVKNAQLEHRESVSRLEAEYQEHRERLNRQTDAASSHLIQLEVSIAAARSDLDAERQMLEAEKARAQEAAAEVDRLLSVSERLTTTSSATTTSNGSAVPFAFPERQLVSPKVVSENINSLPILSPKGRDLLRQLVVLMRAGEVPLLYGADAADFVRVAGQVLTPGRVGFMRADPTLVSIEDVWARPGSGTPTILAAASSSVSKGGSVLIAVTDIESSAARFWLPALSEFLRSSPSLRGLLVCALTGDIEHDEVKALPQDVAVLEIEGSFERGAYYGALTLAGVAGTPQFALDPGEEPARNAAAARCVADFGFEPSIGLAMRTARIFSEAVAMLGDETAASKVTVALAKNINDDNY